MLEGQPQAMQGGALMGTALKRKQVMYLDEGGGGPGY